MQHSDWLFASSSVHSSWCLSSAEGGIVRVCHQIACADCVIHFATVPIQHMLPSLSVHWDICKFFRQKGGRLRASVAASPWVLLCVGGGTGISVVVRLCVCVWLCMPVIGFRLQLPPNSPRHHQALFLPPPPPSCPPPPLSHPQSQFVYSNFEGWIICCNRPHWWRSGP